MARYQLHEALHVDSETNVGRVAADFEPGEVTVPDVGEKGDKGHAALLAHACDLGLAKQLPNTPAGKTHRAEKGDR